MLAAHPFKRAPNRIDEAVFRVAENTPHRLILAPSVLRARERPATLRGTPGGLTASCAILAGPEARPVAAGAVFALVPEALDQLRGLVRETRYTYFDQEGLLLVRASGDKSPNFPPRPSLYPTPILCSIVLYVSTYCSNILCE